VSPTVTVEVKVVVVAAGKSGPTGAGDVSGLLCWQGCSAGGSFRPALR
jgi:hypothetical protein